MHHFEDGDEIELLYNDSAIRQFFPDSYQLIRGCTLLRLPQNSGDLLVVRKGDRTYAFNPQCSSFVGLAEAKNGVPQDDLPF